MKPKLTMLLALTITSASIANAQLSVGINAGANIPQKPITDSISFLRSGYSFYFTPAYTFSKLAITGKLGYQSLNLKSGFENKARQNNYTAEKGFDISGKSTAYWNVALGVDYNILPTGTTACGTPKPALLIGAQFGLLNPTNSGDLSIKYQGKETIYAISQSTKALPYINAHLQIAYPLCERLSLTSGVAYNKTLSDMEWQQTSNGRSTTMKTSYSDIQLSVGAQLSFRKAKKAAKKAAVAAKGENPLYEAGGSQGTNPMNESKTVNPLYKPSGNQGVNPMNQSKTENPLYSPGGSQGTNPMHESSTRINDTKGNPIPGLSIKGGANPGAGLTVLNNGKGITEKGIKRSMPANNGKGITEKGIPYKVIENTANAVDNKTQSITYSDDFMVLDPLLLAYLGVDELTIQKGEYNYDYSKNPEGEVTFLVKQKIVHRDIAARNLLLRGVNPDNTYFDYTIEPLFVNGVADKIIVSYKGITEKGIK